MESVVVEQVAVEVVDFHEKLQRVRSVTLSKCSDWHHRFRTGRMDTVS